MVPSVSVQIAQWGKTDFTERCVDALRRSDYAGEIEVLVYDNSSPGGPGAVARRSDVQLILGSENIGFGPAHNQMASIASGELLLILNNDTVVTPSAIRTLAETLGDLAVGAVSPRYVGFDGLTLELGGFVGQGAEGWQLFRGESVPHVFETMLLDADYGSAACLLLRREEFLDVGGFDDAFAPAYYEDTDFCFKLSSQGKRIVVNPRAVVYHFEGATAGKDTAFGLKQLQVEHRSVFADRWSQRLSDEAPASSEAALAKALDLGNDAVLWLSPELPRPDHEAGHARLVRMLQSLKQAGSSVVLWAEMAPEWRTYGRMLEEAGIAWFAFRDSARATPQARHRYSTIEELLAMGVWSQVVVSFPEMAQRFLGEIRKLDPSLPVVVDAVDLHFLRMERDPDTPDSEARAMRDLEQSLYRAVDGVITAGDHETDELVQIAPGTPTRVFTSVSTIEVADNPLASVGGDLVFLGNMNHAPNLAAVDYWADEIFPLLGRENASPLMVFGSGSERFEGRWNEDAVRVRGWAPDLVDLFSGARCFVAPLTFGAGTKGKILDAAAAGVPIVTTPVGAEGYSGLLLDAMHVGRDASELAQAVTELSTDDHEWSASCRHIQAGAAAWEAAIATSESEWASWLLRRSRG